MISARSSPATTRTIFRPGFARLRRELLVKNGDKLKPIPHRKLQAVVTKLGEVAVNNPNSAVIWHYDKVDRNADGKIDFEEEFHRTLASPAIKNDLVFIPDFSGLMHCLNANTGKVHWTCDMLAAVWGSPLIAEDKVYLGDEDGDVAIFALSADPKLSIKTNEEYAEPAREMHMINSVYSTPIVANGVLYISDRSHLYAIQDISNSKSQISNQKPRSGDD